MKKYLQFALMIFCMSAVFTSCKDDDDSDDVAVEAYTLENEQAFAAKANDPDFFKAVSYTHLKEIAYTGQTTMKILLEEDSQALDEVVVTALGMSRDKKSLGYAMTELLSLIHI